MSNNYFKFKNINDSEIVKFRSKRYVYGFIENAPYDTLLDNKLAGINYQLLSNFSKLTKAEISYKKYNNISSLVNAFNSNEIDLFYGINSTSDYNLDVYNTIPVYNNTAIVLKHSSNDLIINSIKSLDNVVSIENSYLSEYLTNNNITVTAYSNMEDLINIPGVGRKSANVIMLEAFHNPQGIAVDTHAKRISNRVGFSKESDPLKIEQDLLKLFPKKYYYDVNHLLVWHGRNTCTARNPKCESCPISNICKKLI